MRKNKLQHLKVTNVSTTDQVHVYEDGFNHTKMGQLGRDRLTEASSVQQPLCSVVGRLTTDPAAISG